MRRICEKCFDSWACEDSNDDGNEKECFHPRPSEAMEVRKMDEKPLLFMDLKASDIVTVEPLPPPVGPIFLTHDEIEGERLKMEKELDTEPRGPLLLKCPMCESNKMDPLVGECLSCGHRSSTLAGKLLERVEKTPFPDLLPGMAVRMKETGDVGIVQECFWRGKVLKIRPDDGGMYVIKVWVLDWVAREVPVLHRYESAADGWERIPEAEIVEKNFQAKPESCLEQKEK